MKAFGSFVIVILAPVSMTSITVVGRNTSGKLDGCEASRHRCRCMSGEVGEPVTIG
jgi:hypothetical protein